jgi:hypothetical protein
MKLTIEYDSLTGHVCKDGEAQGWVDDIIHRAINTFPERDDLVVTVASALLVDFFRMRLCEGIIKTDQIAFTFNGEVLKHNKYGRIEHWPDGYCDIPIYPMERLLILAADMAKKERKANDKS